MEQDYYFISVPDTNKNPITNPKKDQNSFFVSDEGYDIEAPESRFPFVKKIKGGGGGNSYFQPPASLLWGTSFQPFARFTRNFQ